MNSQNQKTEYFSIKMRANQNLDDCKRHISGAEKIVTKEELANYAAQFVERALTHSKGEPDFLNIKIERIEEEILEIPPLKVSTCEVETVDDGFQKIEEVLGKLDMENPKAVLEKMSECYDMRGAMLLNVDTLERLEYDQNRGIRATFMDWLPTKNAPTPKANGVACDNVHFKEALVLATKVLSAPNIIGEICISDDPDYITGYVSTKEVGYQRITKLKELDSPNGGRIFLYRGNSQDAQKTIDYIENKPVMVCEK